MAKAKTDNDKLAEIARGLLMQVESLGREFARRRNPATDSPPMTNWTTQLFGNRPVSASATWELGDREFKVEIDKFMPARDEKNNPVKKYAGTIRKIWASGKLADDKVVDELLQGATYFVTSCMTGQLPSPKRLSAESTLKGHVLAAWAAGGNLELKALTIHGDDGAEMTYKPDRVSAFVSTFDDNARHVLETWNVANGRGGGNLEEMDFLL